MLPNQVTINRGTYIANRDLLSEIRAALGRQPLIRALDLDHFTVSMKDGVVYLAGHVRLKQLIEATAADVVGNDALHSELVDDRALAGMLAQALASEPETSSYGLRVDVDHGWVRVFGAVPSKAVQAAVTGVLAQYPQVRGIVRLPEVAGKSASVHRSPVQPPIKAEVIPDDGPLGRVKQVVIDPYNRLVTHMIVQTAGQDVAGRASTNREYVVPVEEIVGISSKTVYLRRGRSLVAHPEFSEADFPLPPPRWEPPFPYSMGAVRWAREDLHRKQQSEELPEAAAPRDDRVTISSKESFPASDAPSWTMGKR